ncbi:tRNA pseudouridine(55) synthase TruB [Pelotomaculum propionicicum]|uniref:tRNA pseudouridine(55) synthase TruB n=1 Tax=Pelotomaculum propionicicum TaxID=258475 RepID=UPI003B79A37E
MDGFINVLKPPGMTSHDVVNFFRRLLGIKKVGHTGTLDPGAAGVLLICLGGATRLAGYLTDEDKEYRAEITFGIATLSGDAYGEVTSEIDASGLSEDEVRSVLPRFHGKITQVPPMTSAIKINGKKLYELARAGLTVDRPGRVVNINSLEFISGTGWGTPRPRALLHLSCSKGFYVRSLCLDIGTSLGCGAHMSFLVRTGAGPYKIHDSLTLEEIKFLKMKNTLEEKVININQALSGLPAVLVKNGAVPAVQSGAKLYPPGVAELPVGLQEGDRVRLVGQEGFLAVAETSYDPRDNGRLVFKPVCVLPR